MERKRRSLQINTSPGQHNCWWRGIHFFLHLPYFPPIPWWWSWWRWSILFPSWKWSIRGERWIQFNISTSIKAFFLVWYSGNVSSWHSYTHSFPFSQLLLLLLLIPIIIPFLVIVFTKRLVWEENEWTAIIGINLLMKFQVIPTRFTHLTHQDSSLRYPAHSDISLLFPWRWISFPKCHFVSFYFDHIFPFPTGMKGRYSS